MLWIIDIAYYVLTYSYASKYGNLEVLKWMQENSG